jgi:hypothetical protein
LMERLELQEEVISDLQKQNDHQRKQKDLTKR